MSWASTIDIIRHFDPDGAHIVRSHILHPHADITILCIVLADKENVVSVLEDHLLETISSTGWNEGEEESDFTFVTEKYNHFQRNLAESDIRNTSGLFAVLVWDALMVSVAGNMCATLRERNGTMSLITEHPLEGSEFTSISHGNIPPWSQIFFSSQPLSSFLSDDCLDECSDLSHESFEETLEWILKRDAHETIHIIRLENTPQQRKPLSSSRGSKNIVSQQVDIARGFIADVYSQIPRYQKLHIFWERLSLFFEKKTRSFLLLFLIVGWVLFFGLIYSLIWALFTSVSTPQSDAKNQILRAQTLIESSQKLTSNSQAFNSNIKEAENILFKIRDQQEYIRDTQELLQRIEAMKKEMYDIQSIDLKKKESIIKFNPEDISPLWLFEYGKKLNLIGKTSSILGYIPWNPLTALTSYPPGEEVQSVDMTEDGNFYFLTKNNRVLSNKQNEITYVSVTGQDTWENANTLHSFNNNIYLVDRTSGQVLKHRPGLNGFSQKSEVLPKSLSGILDVGIDGWFYIVTDEPKIMRIVSKDGYTQNGITLNKIPGEFRLGKPEDTQIVVRQNLNFIYLLSGDRIWIFEPDSKRFQDVRAWNYIAQLEISTDQSIRAISIPRDGFIYVITNLGVYDVPFDFIDKNIILKH